MIDKSEMTEEGGFAQAGFDVPEQLEAAAVLARKYLANYSWCRRVNRVYFDRGIPQAAVFYCEIEPNPPADAGLWVIVGDLSPLYIDIKSAHNGAEAMDQYVALMQELVDAVRSGEPLDDFPVLRTQTGQTPLIPDSHIIAELESRLGFIRSRLIPEWQGEIGPWRRRIAEEDY